MKWFWKLIFRLRRAIEAEQTKQVKKQLMFCGENIFLHPTCHILVPQQLKIGNNTSISSYTTIFATFGVSIGENCLISSNCGISSYNHVQNSTNRIATVDQDKLYSKAITIEDNVWIGMNVSVLPGVTIGRNAVIGSGSVVTKNIPENEIWVGNPATFLKKLTIIS